MFCQQSSVEVKNSVAPHYVVNIHALLWLPGVRVGKICEQNIVLTQDGLARGNRLQLIQGMCLTQQSSSLLPVGTFLWIQEHKATMLSEGIGEKIKVEITIPDKSSGVKVTM